MCYRFDGEHAQTVCRRRLAASVCVRRRSRLAADPYR